MGEKSSSPITRIDLPIPINEFQNLNTLEVAKAYTLQLLEWSGVQDCNRSATNQDTDCVQNSSNDLLTWLRNFNPEERLKEPLQAYKTNFQSAYRVIPFIKSDLQRMMKKQKNHQGYSSSMDDEAKKPGVLEVDAFLYDSIDEPLEAQGMDSNVQCQVCRSSDCQEIDREIDQNTSIDSVLKLYTLLSEKCLNDKTRMVIIGSGIGSFAYGAFLFSDMKNIVSCEWEDKFLSLQEHIVEKHKMSDRVKIENSIVPQDPGILKATDLVIISNRISNLTSKQQCEVWNTIKCHLKPGTIILTTRDINHFFREEKQLKDLCNWVRPEPEFQLGNSKADECDSKESDCEDDDYSELKYYIYKVTQ